MSISTKEELELHVQQFLQETEKQEVLSWKLGEFRQALEKKLDLEKNTLASWNADLKRIISNYLSEEESISPSSSQDESFKCTIVAGEKEYTWTNPKITPDVLKAFFPSTNGLGLIEGESNLILVQPSPPTELRHGFRYRVPLASDSQQATSSKRARDVEKKRSGPSSKKTKVGNSTGDVAWEENEQGELFMELGGKKRATIREFRSRPMLDVRCFFEAKDGVLRPTKKGLTLYAKEWQLLCQHRDSIDAYFESMSAK